MPKLQKNNCSLGKTVSATARRNLNTSGAVELKTHRFEVRSLAMGSGQWHSSGKDSCTWGADGPLKFWRAETNNEIWSLFCFKF
jgi:hypothetical protein